MELSNQNHQPRLHERRAAAAVAFLRGALVGIVAVNGVCAGPRAAERGRGRAERRFTTRAPSRMLSDLR